MTLSRRQVLGAGAVAAAALVAGCTSGTLAATPVGRGPGTEHPAGLPPVRHSPSLPSFMRHTFASAAPERVKEVGSTDRWRRYLVVYPSAGLDISGVLAVPRGPGPFPAVVLAHGYSPPAQYISGRGMGREQHYLADRGFVVLQTDYRGHAASSGAGDLEMELGLGFAEDALNAAQSLKEMPEVDPVRVAMFGLSMGGGVTCNALVLGPGIVRAAALWASVSSRFDDNYYRLLARGYPRRVDAIRRTFGTPTEADSFFADMSARTFFNRITAPVLLDHGTSDPICPVGWSRATASHLEEAGVDVRLRLRRREGHTYGRRWLEAMDDTYGFLAERLNQG